MFGKLRFDEKFNVVARKMKRSFTDVDGIEIFEITKGCSGFFLFASAFSCMSDFFGHLFFEMEVFSSLYNENVSIILSTVPTSTTFSFEIIFDKSTVIFYF